MSTIVTTRVTGAANRVASAFTNVAGAPVESVGYERRARARAVAVAGALLCSLAALTVVRYAPPAPRSADAPAEAFSAARARRTLDEVLQPHAPRPTGSAANAAARDRIVAHLAGLGYAPDVQREFVCSGYGQALCVEIANIVVRIEGSAGTRAVGLVAHHDSVPAGPGASDAGTSVAAALEIARALRATPRPRNPIVILLDDGEEAGLIGADAYIEKYPGARDVRRLVNLEARGSWGPSVLFETGAGNAPLIAQYAEHVPRPVGTSLFNLVYDLMPNDTSFTAFRAGGVKGFNFANVGGTASHHTQRDEASRIDWGTVQQQGDHALAAVRALAASNLEEASDEDAVFFDVFAFTSLWWPARWSPPAGVVLAVLFATVVILLVRRGETTARGVVLAAVAWIFRVAAVAAAGWVVLLALEAAGAFTGPWSDRPGALIAAFWLLAATTVAVLVSRRVETPAIWTGGWLLCAVLAAITAFLAPAASYLFLLPCAAATLGGVFVLAGKGSASIRWTVAALVPAAVTAALWMPVAWLVYDAQGTALLPVIAVLVTIAVGGAAPLIAGAAAAPVRRAARLTLAASFLIAAVLSIVAGRRVEELAPMNMVLHFDATTAAGRWLAESDNRHLPEPLQKVAGFGVAPEKPFPWAAPAERTFVAPATGVTLAAPVLSIRKTEVQPDGRRTVLAQVRSARGARDISLQLPPGAAIESVRVAGKRAPIDRGTRWRGGWHVLTCLAVPPEGLEIEFTLRDSTALEIVLSDRSGGLPAAADALQRARPAAAVPFRAGDGTIVTTRVTI